MDMKSRAVIAGTLLAGGVLWLGYWFASGKSLDHEITYLAILAGFVICDRSFWPGRNR